MNTLIEASRIVAGGSKQLKMITDNRTNYSKLDGGKDKYNEQIAEALKNSSNAAEARKLFNASKVYGNSTEVKVLWESIYKDISLHIKELAE